MKKSRMLGVVCIVASIFTSISANAAILKFDFSGLSDAYFGPVVSLSGSFLFDTGAPLTEYSPITLGGISYVGRFVIEGGVSIVQAQLDGLWSLDNPVNSYISAERTGAGIYDGFISLDDGTNSFYFYFIHLSLNGDRTTQEWMNSSDPVAQFFSDSIAHTAVSNSLFSANVANNPDYPYGYASGAGSIYLNTVPITPASWLFCTGLFGLIGITRRKQVASWLNLLSPSDK